MTVALDQRTREASPPGDTRAVPSRLGRNISALAAGQLATWVLGIAWTLVVPRVLGPSRLGILVAAGAVTAILSLVLGVGNLTYFVREMVARPLEAPSIIATAIAARMIIAPVFIIAIAVYASVEHLGGQASLVFYLVAVAVLVGLLCEPIQGAFQAMERMGYVAISNVVTTALASLAAIVLVLAGGRLVALAVGGVLVALGGLVLNVYWAHRHSLIEVKTNTAKLGALVKGSLPYWSTALAFMVYLMIDSVILSVMERSEVVGWYGVATKLFGSLLFVPTVIGTAWFPRLVASFEEHESRLAESARPYIELLVVLSIPICAATAMAAKPVMRVLYGQGFAKAAPVLVVLGFCVPLTYLGIGLFQVLCASKRPLVMTRLLVVTCAANAALNVVLIPVFQRSQGNGALGSAVSLLITEVIMTSALFFVVGRQLVNRSFVARVVRTLGAAGAMWAAFVVSRPFGAAGALSSAAIAFIVAALALRVPSPEERKAVSTFAAKVLPGRKKRLHRRGATHRRVRGADRGARHLASRRWSPPWGGATPTSRHGAGSRDVTVAQDEERPS